MDKLMIKTLIEQADSELVRARNENYKPAEDVVSYCSCVSARSALYRYLKAYHLHGGALIENREQDTLTMDQLLEESKRKFPELDKLDFSNINCSDRNVLATEDLFFCNDVEVVDHCTKLAEQVRELLIKKLPDDLQPNRPAFL